MCVSFAQQVSLSSVMCQGIGDAVDLIKLIHVEHRGSDLVENSSSYVPPQHTRAHTHS